MGLIGKGHRHVDFGLVLRFVRPVLDLALGLPELHRGQAVLPGQLLGVVYNAVFIGEFRFLKLAVLLVPEHKGHAVVDNGLPLDNVQIVFRRHIDVGEHFQVRLPADAGAGILLFVVLPVEAPYVFALFKVQGIPAAAAANVYVHVFRSILGGAEPQAIEAQGILIAAPLGVVVLTAGVHLAEHQLPVVALLLLVKIHGNAPAEILHLYRMVLIAGDDNLFAKALPGLVDGVGEDFKNRVLAALQAVGAEDDGRAAANPVRPLQRGNAVVTVSRFFCHRLASFIKNTKLLCWKSMLLARGLSRQRPSARKREGLFWKSLPLFGFSDTQNAGQR